MVAKVDAVSMAVSTTPNNANTQLLNNIPSPEATAAAKAKADEEAAVLSKNRKLLMSSLLESANSTLVKSYATLKEGVSQSDMDANNLNYSLLRMNANGKFESKNDDYLSSTTFETEAKNAIQFFNNISKANSMAAGLWLLQDSAATNVNIVQVKAGLKKQIWVDLLTEEIEVIDSEIETLSAGVAEEEADIIEDEINEKSQDNNLKRIMMPKMANAYNAIEDSKAAANLKSLKDQKKIVVDLVPSYINIRMPG